MKHIYLSTFRQKNFPHFFCDWYDGPACLHQESGGVDPPTPIGGHPGGDNPNFYPKNTKLQRARLSHAPMEFSMFQWISTGNDLNFYIYQIQNGVVQYSVETSQQS